MFEVTGDWAFEAGSVESLPVAGLSAPSFRDDIGGRIASNGLFPRCCHPITTQAVILNIVCGNELSANPSWLSVV